MRNGLEVDHTLLVHTLAMLKLEKLKFSALKLNLRDKEFTIWLEESGSLTGKVKNFSRLEIVKFSKPE